MPHVIDELPKSTRGRSGSKYEEWVPLYEQSLKDGKVIVVVRGEDFTAEVNSVRQMIYREVAEKLGKAVKSAAMEVEGKEALAFQVQNEAPKKRGSRKAKGNGGEKATASK